MISKNIPFPKERERGEKPFLLRAASMDYLWGGRRLMDDYGKDGNEERMAESWECATHPDGVSLVASGVYEGLPLDQVLQQHPEYQGTDPIQKYGTEMAAAGQLPILLKLIDAREDLSVQVHPDDDFAAQEEGGQRGKTEFWYVADAKEGAELVYGLRHSISGEKLRSAIEEKTLSRYLQKVPVRKNDVFMVEAGTIHGIGSGTLIAEIQENSNLTYRLYDYDRTDQEGRKRPLHIEKALQVAKLGEAAPPKQPLRLLRYRRGSASELLCRCRYFQVSRLLINTEQCRSMAIFKADSSSFRVLLCLDGCGSMVFGGESLHFFKGDCIFVPANSMEIAIHGKAQFLDIRA